MDVIMEVIVMIIVLGGGSFLLSLRKRGIILYFPNKKAKGTITKVVTKHRTVRDSRRENGGGRRINITEKFAEVEFYDGTRMVIAESLFPVLDDAKVGDEVVVSYREGREGKVYVSEKR